MAFMEPEIIDDTMIHIDTTEGTELVSTSLVLGDVCFRCGSIDTEILKPYLRGEPHRNDYLVRAGFYARLSASGYMDATDWTGPSTTREEALREICDTHDICRHCFEQCWDNPLSDCEGARE